MVKSIIKELFILILLLITIVLIFAVILYDYNPLSKTMPKQVEAYTLPEEVQTELEGSLGEEEKIIKTYQVDARDLDKFKKNDEYNPGKIEPYSMYNSVEQPNSVDGENNNSQTGNGLFFNTPGK